MRIWRGVAWVALASAMAATVAVACSNGAVGVQACRQIETARCEAAPGCPSLLAPTPVADGDPVAACVRFYNDACLHGLVTPATPSNAEVNACVAGINAAGKMAATERDASAAACAFLASPWTQTTGVTAPWSAACAFLDAGVVATVDAGEDAGVAHSGEDGGGKQDLQEGNEDLRSS
jgi:hypothetical protein